MTICFYLLLTIGTHLMFSNKSKLIKWILARHSKYKLIVVKFYICILTFEIDRSGNTKFVCYHIDRIFMFLVIFQCVLEDVLFYFLVFIMIMNYKCFQYAFKVSHNKIKFYKHVPSFILHFYLIYNYPDMSIISSMFK